MLGDPDQTFIGVKELIICPICHQLMEHALGTSHFINFDTVFSTKMLRLCLFGRGFSIGMSNSNPQFREFDDNALARIYQKIDLKHFESDHFLKWRLCLTYL